MILSDYLLGFGRGFLLLGGQVQEGVLPAGTYSLTGVLTLRTMCAAETTQRPVARHLDSVTSQVRTHMRRKVVSRELVQHGIHTASYEPVQRTLGQD